MSYRIEEVIIVGGRGASPPDNCGRPRAYAEQLRDALGWPMADDVDTVVAVLQRVIDGDTAALDGAGA